MIGHEEWRRLMTQYGGGAACRAAVAAKCAVCLGMLSLIAYIGSYEGPTGRTADAMATRESPSLRHARSVYEDRAIRRTAVPAAAGAARVIATTAVAATPDPAQTLSVQNERR